MREFRTKQYERFKANKNITLGHVVVNNSLKYIAFCQYYAILIYKNLNIKVETPSKDRERERERERERRNK